MSGIIPKVDGHVQTKIVGIIASWPLAVKDAE